jgi:hypothetical protein
MGQAPSRQGQPLIGGGQNRGLPRLSTLFPPLPRHCRPHRHKVPRIARIKQDVTDVIRAHPWSNTGSQCRHPRTTSQPARHWIASLTLAMTAPGRLASLLATGLLRSARNDGSGMLAVLTRPPTPYPEHSQRWLASPNYQFILII